MTWYDVSLLGCTVGLAVFAVQVRPPDASRQAQLPKESPRGSLLGGIPLAGLWSEDSPGRPPRPLDVVATALDVSEKRGELRLVHDMCTVVNPRAVPHGDYVAKIGCYLDAAAIRIACPGLSPDGTRQISHDNSSRSESCFRYTAVSRGSSATSTARSKESI